MRGDLTKNLMMLLIDLGSWMRIAYGCACSRRGLYSTYVGVNTIVFGLAYVCHLMVGCTESSACSRACDDCDGLSGQVAVWFWYLLSTVVRCLCTVGMVTALKRLKAEGAIKP